jgi:hypothetical protein
LPECRRAENMDGIAKSVSSRQRFTSNPGRKPATPPRSAGLWFACTCRRAENGLFVHLKSGKKTCHAAPEHVVYFPAGTWRWAVGVGERRSRRRHRRTKKRRRTQAPPLIESRDSQVRIGWGRPSNPLRGTAIPPRLHEQPPSNFAIRELTRSSLTWMEWGRPSIAAWVYEPV